MKAFSAAFKNEIEKMYKKKKAVVVVFISILVIVLGQLAVTGVRSGLGLRASGGVDFSLLVLSFFVNSILPLFTALIAIDIFAGEFSHNTMKNLIVRPITRFKLFSAKITAIATFIFANLMIVMVLSFITGLLFSSSTITLLGIYRVVISYLVTIIPVMVFALIIVFMANYFRSGIVVFFLSIILFIVFKSLGIIFPKYSSFFITSMFDWYNVWIVDGTPFFKIIREFIMMLGYGIMFYTVGYYLFQKKDL